MPAREQSRTDEGDSMDVHDSLGTERTDGTRSTGEPPGREADSATATGSTAHDGHAGGIGASGDSETTRMGDAVGGQGSTPSDNVDTSGTGTMIVEVDGRTRELPAEHDYTGDGKADAVVETPDGKFNDTANTE